ncbi:MAG: DUF924 domain-containing protein [Alphaproteobacteria bacterium]|nr:DUF924 domain-containing protein [Alphaproteobacteria bacterium]
MNVSADEVLAFWFDEAGRDAWFEKDEAFDETVRARFGEACHAARDGKLETWVESPRGCLALIILIDQFSRNIHRDSPLAWSADIHALALTKLAIDKGYDQKLGHAHRMFLYMPLMHSENLADQELSVEMFERLAQDGAENGETTVEFAERHRDIVARFGRFPHRNETLGRESTPEEEEFLKEPDSSF